MTSWTIQSMEYCRPEYWSGFSSSGDLPTPGIKPRSSTLQVNSLPAEPPGKPKNTEVGSLSLPQRIFPFQESNQGLLHCRQILYQLSYQGSILYFYDVFLYCFYNILYILIHCITVLNIIINLMLYVTIKYTILKL